MEERGNRALLGAAASALAWKALGPTGRQTALDVLAAIAVGLADTSKTSGQGQPDEAHEPSQEIAPSTDFSPPPQP